MKKPVCLLLICFLAEMASAQMKGGRVTASPTINNTSIRRSEKAEGRQISNFQSHRRYSAVVNSHYNKQFKRNRDKAQQSQQTEQKKER